MHNCYSTLYLSKSTTEIIYLLEQILWVGRRPRGDGLDKQNINDIYIFNQKQLGKGTDGRRVTGLEHF